MIINKSQWCFVATTSGSVIDCLTLCSQFQPGLLECPNILNCYCQHSSYRKSNKFSMLSATQSVLDLMWGNHSNTQLTYLGG